ncbi:MAG: SIMPL domain-containing protein [Bacteroidia bacterium]|nr:SIMPL domain-containing protein [Bacteroidia bacterium]
MKKRIVILATLIFGLTPFCFDAQDIKKPYIEATGSSETEIVPDEIYVTITLQERQDGKDKLTIEKQEDDLKQNLKEIGIDISNLSLNTANADFRKIKSLKKDVVTSKSYLLKVGNAETVTKVYERLDKINAHDAYISKLNHSRILEFTKENRIKAIKAAKDKVEYLAAAVGNQLGGPIQITETINSVENNPYGNPYNYRMSNAVQSYGGMESSESVGDEISFKKIKIKASFLVKYEILNK